MDHVIELRWKKRERGLNILCSKISDFTCEAGCRTFKELCWCSGEPLRWETRRLESLLCCETPAQDAQLEIGIYKAVTSSLLCPSLGWYEGQINIMWKCFINFNAVHLWSEWMNVWNEVLGWVEDAFGIYWEKLWWAQGKNCY